MKVTCGSCGEPMYPTNVIEHKNGTKTYVMKCSKCNCTITVTK